MSCLCVDGQIINDLLLKLGIFNNIWVVLTKVRRPGTSAGVYGRAPRFVMLIRLYPSRTYIEQQAGRFVIFVDIRKRVWCNANLDWGSQLFDCVSRSERAWRRCTRRRRRRWRAGGARAGPTRARATAPCPSPSLRSRYTHILSTIL